MRSRSSTSKRENTALGAFVNLMRAAESINSAVNTGLTEWNLTPSQFGVLEALHHLGSMKQAELGAKILKSPGNITMVTDNLEKRGLVTKKVSEKDRRASLISLTKEGKKLISSIFPAHAKKIEEKFSILKPAEQEELRKLCRILGKQERS